MASLSSQPFLKLKTNYSLSTCSTSISSIAVAFAVKIGPNKLEIQNPHQKCFTTITFEEIHFGRPSGDPHLTTSLCPKIKLGQIN